MSTNSKAIRKAQERLAIRARKAQERALRAQELVGTVNRFGMTVVRMLESRQDGGSWRTFFELRCRCGNTCEVSQRVMAVRKSCGGECSHFRLPEGAAAFNHVYRAYRSGAKKRGLEWSLGEEFFRELTQRNCVYCGLEPSNCQALNTGVFTYSGVDRVDSNLGYRDGNVVPCCGFCNRAKGVKPLAEFEAWLARVRTGPPKCPPPE